MKRFFMIIILCCAATNSMAQEMAADVESVMEVEVNACSDGTVAGADCIDLNTHPTIDRTGELLTLLLEKEAKKAQAFCEQSNKACLSVITPYFKKTPQDYALRSIKLIGDDDLTVQSTVEAKFILGDEKDKNQYTFVFEYHRQGTNKPWSITQVYLKDTAPVALDREFEGAVMDAVGE